MRRVLLVASLFIGMAACADRKDTSVSDTVDVRAAPARVDTVSDTLKVKYDTVTIKEVPQNDIRLNASNTSRLGLVGFDIPIARTALTSDLSIPDKVPDELAEIRKREGRQSGHDD